ncbi:MAG: hypothetical protein ACR2P4_10795 [Gammaproteobacteria bacterium]
MTEKVESPIIKGTLPRGKHLAYQGALFALTIIVSAIETKITPIVLVGCGVASWCFLMQRLQDAGHGFVWSFPVVALGFVSNVLSAKNSLSDEQALIIVFAFIGYLVGFIVICALPTKEDDNPYK